MSHIGRRAGAVVAMVLGWACPSLTARASADFASVKIGGQTVEQVQAATVKVFEGEGYHTTLLPDGLLFEREGSRWDQLAYGSNIGDDKVVSRVRAQVVDLGGGVCRVQCTAYVVRDAGTGVEDEVRLPRRRSGYYRKLLDKVVQKLTTLQVIQE